MSSFRLRDFLRISKFHFLVNPLLLSAVCTLEAARSLCRRFVPHRKCEASKPRELSGELASQKLTRYQRTKSIKERPASARAERAREDFSSGHAMGLFSEVFPTGVGGCFTNSPDPTNRPSIFPLTGRPDATRLGPPESSTAQSTTF